MAKAGLALCFVVLVLLPWGEGVLLAQSGPVRADLGVRAHMASDLPAGVLRGVIFDLESGRPLANAQVYYVGTAVGVLSDDDGGFELPVLADSVIRLQADLIGFARVSGDLSLDRENGWWVQIATEPQRLGCGMMVCPYPGCGSGVRAVVRDHDSGHAPSTPVTLTVVSAGQTSTTTQLPPLQDSAYVAGMRRSEVEGRVYDSTALAEPVKLWAGGELGTWGPFQVLVEADGYLPWEAENVWLRERECLPPVSDFLRVWLQPSG